MFPSSVCSNIILSAALMYLMGQASGICPRYTVCYPHYPIDNTSVLHPYAEKARSFQLVAGLYLVEHKVFDSSHPNVSYHVHFSSSNGNVSLYYVRQPYCDGRTNKFIASLSVLNVQQFKGVLTGIPPLYNHHYRDSDYCMLFRVSNDEYMKPPTTLTIHYFHDTPGVLGAVHEVIYFDDSETGQLVLWTWTQWLSWTWQTLWLNIFGPRAWIDYMTGQPIPGQFVDEFEL